MTDTDKRMLAVEKILIEQFSAEFLKKENPFCDKFNLPSGRVICSRDFERKGFDISVETVKNWIQQETNQLQL